MIKLSPISLRVQVKKFVPTHAKKGMLHTNKLQRTHCHNEWSYSKVF